MTTAYNIANKLHRSKVADRTSRVDPGSAGVILVGPIDQAVCICTGAGTRTLEDAAKSGVGTSVLCLSQTAAVVIAGATSVTIGDGEFCEFICVQDSSGDNEWQPVSSSKSAVVAQAAKITITGNTSAYVEATINLIVDTLVANGMAIDSTTT
jgi:hypothetical protein